MHVIMPKKKIKFRFSRILIIVILAVIVVMFSIQPRERNARIDQLKTFTLSGYKRLLVFAPHEDDETLGQAGLIQRALAQGMEVKVVIETNGDGYLFATIEEFRKAFPTSGDYIHLGNIRQQESLNALKVLGVQPSNVIFLSYPDRGTPELWVRSWNPANPFESPYTETTHSPYAITFNPQSNYSGEDLLKDISTILEDYNPDLIVYPNPEDVHPDHRGLSDFVRLAVQLERMNTPGFAPMELTYLVHRPQFPAPHGYLPNDSLLPPLPLFNINPNWYSFGLTADEINKKFEAIQQYKSQLPSLRGLLESFVRSNELFTPVTSVTLPEITSGVLTEPATWLKSAGIGVDPVELDPIKDATSRNALGAGDLVRMYAAQAPDNILYICAETRDDVDILFTYYLHIKAYNGTDFTDLTFKYGGLTGKDPRAFAKGTAFCGSTGLKNLGNPIFFMASAEVQSESLITLDRMAWQLILVKK